MKVAPLELPIARALAKTLSIPSPGPGSPIAIDPAERTAFAEMLRRRPTGVPPWLEGPRERTDAQRSEPDDPAPSRDAVLPPAVAIAHGVGSAVDATPTGAREVAAPMADLFSRFVVAAAIGGDVRRGTLRVELGGRRERGHVTVTASGNEIEIEIGAIEGVDATGLEARLAQRLAARGLRLVSFGMS